MSCGSALWSWYLLWLFGERTEHLHNLSTCTYIHQGKCTYRDVYVQGRSCFLKKTAPNTAFFPLLLTPVCRTVLLVKTHIGSSLCEQQLLPFSLLRPVSQSLIESSPSPKVLATYRKTRISWAGAGWELCCVVIQLPLLHPNKTICSLRLCMVSEPQLFTQP